MSQIPNQPITVAEEVTNYPVLLGDLAEIHSFSRLPSILFLRLLAIEEIHWDRVVVSVGHQDVDPDVYEADSGIRVLLSYRDVVLPWWCLFRHPIAW